jgi:hypothetical protein
MMDAVQFDVSVSRSYREQINLTNSLTDRNVGLAGDSRLMTCH